MSLLQTLPDSAADSTPAVPLAPSGELVPFTGGAFSIPPVQLGEFQKLTEAERERILLLLSCFQRMENNVVAQSSALALQLKGLRGYSDNNLQRLYYAHRRGGWRALVRDYNGPKETPDEFREWFKAQCEKNSRSIRAQIGIIKRLWKAGESIPGYGTWREWFAAVFPEYDMPQACPGYPNGWSQSNLYTLQPPKAERLLKTRGYAAAKQYLPSIIRDTSKLRPLELIVLDDFEIDQLCVHHDPEKGTRQVCRVSGLLAMDVATRRKLALGMKPRVENDAGTKESILRRELRYLLYCLISEWGLPHNYPITILCENASAAIEHDLELALGRLFGGRIRVTRTGLIEQRTLGNGFVQHGGKPWEKGWIESCFNSAWNIAAVLPGQKGPRYDKKPAELAARVLYTERLLSTGARGLNLSDEQISQLKLPFRSRDELLQAYEIIFALLESRTDHKMLGFERTQLWRRNEAESWQPFEQLAALPADQQLAVSICEQAESPLERWKRLDARPENIRDKIDEHVLAALLLHPKKAKLRNGRVTFTHQGRNYIFADQRAYALNEREGQAVLCFFDEAKMDCVHVYDAKGAHIQTIQRLGQADITDPASIAASVATVKAIENQSISNVRNRHADEAAEIVGMIRNNEAVAPGAQLDPSIRRSLGLTTEALGKILPAGSVDAALAARADSNTEKGITKASTPAPLPAGLTRSLAQGRTAGPASPDSLAGAAALSDAAAVMETSRAQSERIAQASERAIKAAGQDLSAEEVDAALDHAPTAGEETFSADEISRLLRDDPPAD